MYSSRQLADILLSDYYSNKDLGQNFLVDDSVIESISNLADLDIKTGKKENFGSWFGAWGFNSKIITKGT